MDTPEYTTKICTKCKQSKPATRQFFNINNRNGKLRSMCRECHREYIRPDVKKRLPLLPEVPEGYKCCSKCQCVLPLSAEYFYESARYKYGFSAECKNCSIKRAKANPRKRKSYYKPKPITPDRKRVDTPGARTGKQCPKCKKVYPATTEFFVSNKCSIHGISSFCIECERERGRAKARFRRTLRNEFTESEWRQCLEYFNHRCAVCGKPAGLWHIIAADHWIPASSPDCPGTIAENMIPLCHSRKDGQGGCNLSKHNKPPETWLISRFGKRKAAVILKRITDYFEWVKQQ